MRVCASDTIRFAEVDGLYVILDLVSGNYFILNETASEMWELLLHASSKQEDSAIKGRQRDDDLNSFIAQCLELQFLSTQPKERLRRSQALRSSYCNAKRFLIWRAWLSLTRTAASMRMKGFPQTYLNYSNLGDARCSLDGSDLITLAQDAFLSAENVFWYRRAPEDCLPRSLALFRFLRCLGIPAIHRIGGRRVPIFFMHAWVEHNGVVILDDQRNASECTVLASIPA
jgi:transglutaminase superfamily protein/coenzyme PQQ synthesis protein D (PqqD)